jgi:hypothetical protein
MHLNYHRFNSPFFLCFNLKCSAQKFFGTISSVVFGYYSVYFIKNYYFPLNKTTNKIENAVKKNIPYEKKYNKQFENTNSDDECNIPSEILNPLVVSLKEKYKQELYSYQDEFSEIQSFYFNNDDESDDDDIYDDEEAMLLKDKIIKLRLLLKNDKQIEINAFNQYFNNVKSTLMESLKNNFILENTPIGNVVMVYNCKKEGFSYYSDKSISNKYLESVCKKYCIQFKCKILFNEVFIYEGKLSNFKIIKNEVHNNNKKNAKLSFRSFKEQFALF